MGAIVTIDEIRNEIEELSPEYYESVLAQLRALRANERLKKHSQGTFMSRMREIQFEGPEDFSEKLDEYLYGDKSLD
jgi:hypothetical protein